MCHSNLRIPKQWEKRQVPGFERRRSCRLRKTGATSQEVAEAGSEHADLGPGQYTPFVDLCFSRLTETTDTWDYPIQDQWKSFPGADSTGQPAICRTRAIQSEKIRMLRSADINAGPNLQVLNLVAFPRPQFDLPFFCADLVTFPKGHLIVIDVNPLFKTGAYFEKHIQRFMPACERYNKLLPWGGQFTSESLQFFSPSLLWSRLPLEEDVRGTVFSAFGEYLEEWLQLLRECEPETDPAVIATNQEAQHKYMRWRAEKDPGRPVLTRLFGEARCEEYIHNILFDGLETLGQKKFLDYFPEYRLPDGSVNKRRSMAGRSYPERPWDSNGQLII